jgi:hypothetical protein
VVVAAARAQKLAMEGGASVGLGISIFICRNMHSISPDFAGSSSDLLQTSPSGGIARTRSAQVGARLLICMFF